MAQKIPTAISSVANANWQLTIEHIELALKHASPSATGPDGIPYSAYQRCALAGQILCDVALELLKGTTPPEELHFNWAFLVCLPKKPVKVGAIHGDIYGPKQTRPLSLVNTFNRLVASAYRILLEPIFSQIV